MENSNYQTSCCQEKVKSDKKGFFSGILYGLVPHTFCIAFIIFSILGVTIATALFKPFLLNPYFFHILVALSIVFATIAAIFYFKHQGFITLSKTDKGLELSFLPSGIKRKWKYLLTLYGTTVGINLLLFMVIFPIAANLDSGTSLTAAIVSAFGKGENLQSFSSESFLTLKVNIPCPGHAPLITGELKKISGVENVMFRFPNLFDVGYNPEKTTKEEILSLDVFNTYKATIINEEKGEVVGQFIDNSETTQALGGGGGGGIGGGCPCGCPR